jgi:hypothetical protein
MNFWTFLDRNGGGLGFLLVICLLFVFGSCGDGRGCHVELGGHKVGCSR